MRVLVYGGSGSGKSSFAEDYLTAIAHTGPLVYIATMSPEGADARERITRHQDNRRDKGFTTIERYVDLAHMTLPPGCSVLVECLGNLLANEMFSSAGSQADALTAVLGGIAAIAAQAGNVVVVSNDCISDGVRYSPETENYIRNLAVLNNRLAADFDMVVETVCGIPLYSKGGPV